MKESDIIRGPRKHAKRVCGVKAWGTRDFEPLTWDHFRQKLLAVRP